MIRINNNINDIIDLTRVYTQVPEIKPNGLWYAIDNQWVDWCKDIFPDCIHPNNLILDIDITKILIIETPEELLNFYNKYAIKLHGMILIDFKKLTEDYSGVEINNFHSLKYSNILPVLYKIWLHSWDISSGCIWDLSVINNYTSNTEIII